MIVESLAADPRVTVRRVGEPDLQGGCVLYWMQRAQRATDNPALAAAIRAANELGKPVLVFFCLLLRHPVAKLRHYTFMIEGLIDVRRSLERRRVGFVLRTSGGASPLPELLRICGQVRPALVVADENPLRHSSVWRSEAARRLNLPLLSIDADVIVPSAALGKEQYAARTIRPRITRQLARFLMPPENPRAHVPWRAPAALHSLTPSLKLLDKLSIDRSVPAASGFRGGTAEATRALRRFVANGLRGYAENRNHPERDGTSLLSPYLHFGQLGPHTAAMAVREAAAPRADRDAFLEQLIVRRELAINFVRFNPNYDTLKGCEPWALRTLKEHARDRRPYRYSLRQLEGAETHDELWNAAQIQMVSTGWMHGYMRMYWAKKILEWSASAAEAYEIAVRLNDKYELDGRDPNGYAGIAWAIGGKHDRAWGPERQIYGKVRYMSHASTARKFDSKSYVAQWPPARRHKTA
jgi:deoxyribodipyrimidine photo-lyase